MSAYKNYLTNGCEYRNPKQLITILLCLNRIICHCLEIIQFSRMLWVWRLYPPTYQIIKNFNND